MGVSGAAARGEEAAAAAGWLWLLPPAYAIHLLDERLWGMGTAEFATRYLGMYFTNEAWLWLNAPSLVAFTAVGALAARRAGPAWLGVALATHLTLHALGRVPTSLWFAMVAPGVVSGLLVNLPVAVPILVRGARRLPRRALRHGVLAGIASFQPLWHFVLLPVLPEAPAG